MHYFDTSFVAPLILQEETSDKVEVFLAKLPVGSLCISRWTRAEFASLVAREVRMGGLGERDAQAALEQFEAMVAESFHVVTPSAGDFDLATAYIRNFATRLRAGDALHLAVASNQGMASFYTLDQGLLAAAKQLRVKASRGIMP